MKVVANEWRERTSAGRQYFQPDYPTFFAFEDSRVGMQPLLATVCQLTRFDVAHFRHKNHFRQKITEAIEKSEFVQYEHEAHEARASASEKNRSLAFFEVAVICRPDQENSAFAGASDASIGLANVTVSQLLPHCFRRSAERRVLDPAYCATSKLARRVCAGATQNLRAEQLAWVQSLASTV